MRVAAVDIGTNSMRMLIVDGEEELGRWERVTGLGRGVDRTGLLDPAAVDETVIVLEEYGGLLDDHQVVRRRAIATSASRDASNREEFFDRAEMALGVRPTLISGEEEARLAFSGATKGFAGPEPVVVSDIGGGSTEFVTAEGGVSIDIGSVRLTERAFTGRPVSSADLERGRELVAGLFAGVDIPRPGSLLGVAGTWTEIPGLARGPEAEADPTNMVVSRDEVSAVVGMLAGLTIEEAAALPTLNPKRAPVMLGGVVVAEGVMVALGVEEATVSIHDSLDGVVADLLGLP